MPYTITSTSTSLSDLIAQIEAQHAQMRSLERSNLAGVPTITFAGLLWNRTDEPTYGECIMRHDGTAFSPLLKPGGMHARADGSVTFTGHLNLGGNRITNLGAATASDHAPRRDQVLLLAGGTMAGAIAMGGSKITGLGAASASGDALRFEDKWPDGSMALKSLPAAAIDEGALTLNQCDGGKFATFQPRVVEILLAGTVKRVSDGATIGTETRAVLRGVRWNADAGAESMIGLIAGGLVEVYVQFKSTAPRGFYLRLKRVGTGAACRIDTGGTVEAVAYTGVNE
ncbi:MAG: hypothetical protein K2Q20_14830 [Phycisphaerales bacterium]|nr:hypothetical protein [Phycisphaerales bacterium]